MSNTDRAIEYRAEASRLERKVADFTKRQLPEISEYGPKWMSRAADLRQLAAELES